MIAISKLSTGLHLQLIPLILLLLVLILSGLSFLKLPIISLKLRSFVVCIILNAQFMMQDASSIVNHASSIVNPALGILILGIFQLGVSYILYSWAMKHVTAIEAVLLTTLEPILNPVWVALFYGEVPSTMAIIGGVIVVAGVVARNFAYERAHDHTAHPGADR